MIEYPKVQDGRLANFLDTLATLWVGSQHYGLGASDFAFERNMAHKTVVWMVQLSRENGEIRGIERSLQRIQLGRDRVGVLAILCSYSDTLCLL